MSMFQLLAPASLLRAGSHVPPSTRRTAATSPCSTLPKSFVNSCTYTLPHPILPLSYFMQADINVCTRRRRQLAWKVLLLLGSASLMILSRLPVSEAFVGNYFSSRLPALWLSSTRVALCDKLALSGFSFGREGRSFGQRTALSLNTFGNGSDKSDDTPVLESQNTTPSSSPAPLSPSFKHAVAKNPLNKRNEATKSTNRSAPIKKTHQADNVPRSKNLLIVGLGNPGKEYAMTRHNAGFLAVDLLARRLGADFRLRSAFQGEYGCVAYKGKSVGLLKPTTFMNRSGQSLRKVLDYFKLPVSSVLVVVDEVALDIGQIRLRQTGSAGGHNGLKSIESCLKCKDYNRLRIGVGGAAPGAMVDHVLGQFSRSERKVLDDMLIDAVEAIEDWIEDDNTDKVMNRVNAPR